MFANLMKVLRLGVRSAFVGGVEDAMPDAKTMTNTLTVDTANGMRVAVKQAILSGIEEAMIEASGVIIPTIAVEPLKRLKHVKSKAA